MKNVARFNQNIKSDGSCVYLRIYGELGKRTTCSLQWFSIYSEKWQACAKNTHFFSSQFNQKRQGYTNENNQKYLFAFFKQGQPSLKTAISLPQRHDMISTKSSTAPWRVKQPVSTA